MCYRLLITRLQNYMGSDLDQFKKAAQLERILLRHSFSTSNECVTLPVATWQSLCWQWSTSIVHVSSKKNTLSQACTLQVSGNGSWMFNTVSVALVGGESKATELRLLCAIELLLHTQEYTDRHISICWCLLHQRDIGELRKRQLLICVHSGSPDHSYSAPILNADYVRSRLWVTW